MNGKLKNKMKKKPNNLLSIHRLAPSVQGLEICCLRKLTACGF